MSLNAQFKAKDLNEAFLTGPAEFTVLRILEQMSQIKPFTKLFGKYDPTSESCRWADYSRTDWSVRQLPSISVYENESESKESSNGYVNGTIQIFTVWQPNLRRQDLRRIPVAYKGALTNLIESDFFYSLLDYDSFNPAPTRVPGLIELGRTANWMPNMLADVEKNICPVTVFNINYKIDLKRWYLYLEREGRSKADPFNKTSFCFSGIDYTLNGIDDLGKVWVTQTRTLVNSSSGGGS